MSVAKPQLTWWYRAGFPVSKEPLRRLNEGTNVLSVSYSPDGKKIITGGSAGAKIWDAESGRLLQKLEGHNAVTSAVFSTDGTRVVTASKYGTARIWNWAEAAQERVSDIITPSFALDHSGYGGTTIDFAAYSPDGKKIITIDRTHTAWIWDAGTNKMLRKLEAKFDRAVFSPDGKKVVTTGIGQSTAIVRDAASGKELQKLEGFSSHVYSANFSPDGTKIVTAGKNPDARIWDVESGEDLRRLRGHRLGIFYAAFSSDGTKVITAGVDETVRIWDAESGKELQKLEKVKFSGGWAVFSPDGTKILTVEFNETRIWDAATGKVLKKLTRSGNSWGDPGGSRASSAGFSPDGKYVVATYSVGSAGTARIFDVESGKELPEKLELQGIDIPFGKCWNPESNSPNSVNVPVSFSPDGKRIVIPSVRDAALIWILDPEERRRAEENKAAARGNKDAMDLLRTIEESEKKTVQASEERMKERTDTFTAAEQAEIDKFCAKYGTDVNAADEYGRAPLYHAAARWNVAVVKFLVSKGADINVKGPDGWTALHSATCWNKNADVIKFLISRGADVNAKDSKGLTPFREAAKKWDIEVIKFFVSNGADVNAKTNNGMTPLHNAAMNEDVEVAKFLVSKGTDVYARSDSGMTPLHCTSSNKNVEVAKFLVSKGADVNAKDNSGRIPLDGAEASKNTDVIEYLSSLTNTVTPRKCGRCSGRGHVQYLCGRCSGYGSSNYCGSCYGLCDVCKGTGGR